MATTKIFIIEGIAGSGKDTLHNLLENQFNNRTIYSFREEELIFSWKHYWIKDLELIRIQYLHKLLDYCEHLIKQENILILNRFHITYAIISKYNPDAKKLYDKLIKRLNNLPVQILIPILNIRDIEKRASHIERTDMIWEMHLKKRLKQAKLTSLKELYIKEQNMIQKIAKKQRVPYTIIN